MHCLRVFDKNYIVYYNVYFILLVYSLKCMCLPRLALASVSYMPIYVSIVMYGLRLFIVVLQ